MPWFKRSKAQDAVPSRTTTTAAAAPDVMDLSESEREWIELHLQTLEDAGITDADGLGGFFDQQLTHWLALPEDRRPDPNELINQIGVGFGEYVRRDAGLRWVIASDQYGTDLALHGEPGNILVFPATMIGKRWVADEIGQLPVLVSSTVRSVADIRRRAAGT